MLPTLTKLSVIIPARNESGAIACTVRNLHSELEQNAIVHEILVVDDGSRDNTWKILNSVKQEIPELRPLQNEAPHGYGRAVAYGIDRIEGDAAVILMADESDDAKDVVRYWKALNRGYHCVFGSRFVKGAEIVDYPWPKLFLNRLGNKLIQLLFGIGLNDTSNAFKAFRKTALDGCRPFVSQHFNLTVELPLKAITRGFRWTMIPIHWKNRTRGIAKFKIKEMGSRYLFIILYVWLEHALCAQDYHAAGRKGFQKK